VIERQKAFHHVGLLFNEPPGMGRAALYLVIRRLLTCKTRPTGIQSTGSNQRFYNLGLRNTIEVFCYHAWLDRQRLRKRCFCSHFKRSFAARNITSYSIVSLWSATIFSTLRSDADDGLGLISRKCPRASVKPATMFERSLPVLGLDFFSANCPRPTRDSQSIRRNQWSRRYCNKLWIADFQAAVTWGLIPSMN
jgi:hypothetical protein